ncbi:MAG TPA: hypothetical protein VGL27_18625 [Negativicutes bacterium]|jgi:hypothetical protein
MSYVTGFALGISAGKKIGQLFQSKGFQLVHALPKRRRYYYEKLLNNEQLAIAVERQLAALPVIRYVNINATSGTVLLEYDCADQEVDMLLEYLHKACNCLQPDTRYGRLGAEIRQVVTCANAALRKKTQQALDVRTVAAVVFALFGTHKVWMHGQRPVGPQMLWWAYCLLKGR